MTERKKERDGMEGDLERGSGGGEGWATVSDNQLQSGSHTLTPNTSSHTVTYTLMAGINQSVITSGCV